MARPGSTADWKNALRNAVLIKIHHSLINKMEKLLMLSVNDQIVVSGLSVLYLK